MSSSSCRRRRWLLCPAQTPVGMNRCHLCRPHDLSRGSPGDGRRSGAESEPRAPVVQPARAQLQAEGGSVRRSCWQFRGGADPGCGCGGRGTRAHGHTAAFVACSVRVSGSSAEQRLSADVPAEQNRFREDSQAPGGVWAVPSAQQPPHRVPRSSGTGNTSRRTAKSTSKHKRTPSSRLRSPLVSLHPPHLLQDPFGNEHWSELPQPPALPKPGAPTQPTQWCFSPPMRCVLKRSSEAPQDQAREKLRILVCPLRSSCGWSHLWEDLGFEFNAKLFQR